RRRTRRAAAVARVQRPEQLRLSRSFARPCRGLVCNRVLTSDGSGAKSAAMRAHRYSPFTVVCLLAGGFVLASGCSSDDDDTPPPPASCVAGGGPVAGPVDDHCVGPDGHAISQEIGRCIT